MCVCVNMHVQTQGVKCGAQSLKWEGLVIDGEVTGGVRNPNTKGGEVESEALWWVSILTKTQV